MQFCRIGEYLTVSRITGPHHNLLQVRLGDGEQREPVCEQLPAIGKGKYVPLDERSLIARVLEGVAEANERLGTSHSVTHIRYVADDTKPESAYADMSSKLIEHLEADGEFEVGTPTTPNSG